MSAPSPRHLFDAELRYRAGLAPLSEEGEGRLVGSGDGDVAGPVLTGTLRWTLFERPGELVCGMSPLLRIETSDGAVIDFEGRGFAVRERAELSQWRVAATLLFNTDDPRYAWLDGVLGFWEGEFDAGEHTARYRAYAPCRGAA